MPDSEPARPGHIRDRIPAIYESVVRLAERMLHRRPAKSLAPGDLVHEAFILIDREEDQRVRAERTMLGEKSTSSLKACCGAAMHDVLTGRHRLRTAKKRNSGEQPVELPESIHVPEMGPVRTAELNEILEQLEQLDPDLLRIVEARVFSNATIAECSDALGVSIRTVDREWAHAKAWLRERLER